MDKIKCLKYIIAPSLLMMSILSCNLGTKNELSTSNGNNVPDALSKSLFYTNQFLGNTLTVTNDEDAQLLKDKATFYADNKDAKNAIKFIGRYIEVTCDMSILNDHLFSSIKEEKEYISFKNKYKPNLSLVSMLYFISGIMGLFLGFIIVFKKQSNRINAFLIGSIILIHSIFILHLFLYLINGQYYLPSLLFFSTILSFLYGPLLFLYLKRIIFNYRIKRVDVLHLVPSIVLVAYYIPFFLMSDLEKFNIILGQNNYTILESHILSVIKTLILLIYAFPILRLYKKNYVISQNEIMDKRKYTWQNNLILCYLIYMFTYIVYNMNTNEMIDYVWLIHIQIWVMSILVYYVSYSIYAHPDLFIIESKGKTPLQSLFKYEKSGLTPAYSLELKQNVLQLLREDKAYKENEINLEILSEKLGTTRHNVSQVINEHFDMNFSELINKYRIMEAKEILKNDRFNNLNIIQVAYEVGFNNKVTFNKAFKKYIAKTPSQYIKTLQR